MKLLISSNCIDICPVPGQVDILTTGVGLGRVVWRSQLPTRNKSLLFSGHRLLPLYGLQLALLGRNDSRYRRRKNASLFLCSSATDDTKEQITTRSDVFFIHMHDIALLNPIYAEVSHSRNIVNGLTLTGECAIEVSSRISSSSRLVTLGTLRLSPVRIFSRFIQFLTSKIHLTRNRLS